MMHFISKAPYKSVAAALILVLFLGPLGAFYSTLLGGVVCAILGLAAVGMAMSQMSPLPLCTVWLISLVWSMISVRLYNRAIWKTVLEVMGYEESSRSWFKKKEAVATSDE